jgi:hypothetical protein
VKTGHVPDYPVFYGEDGTTDQAHNPRDWVFEGSLLMAKRPLTAGARSWAWSDRLDGVQNQLSGTCVGQSLGSSVYLLGQVHGPRVKRPSAAMIVALAQLADAPGQPVDLETGCRPSVAVARARDKGLVPLEEWPETGDTIDTVPPEDVFATAMGSTIRSYYRIPTSGDVAEGLRQALSRGYFPIFGMTVDDAYENVGGKVYGAPGGAVLGNHAQMVVGYSAPLDAFKVLNSWGTTFAHEGFAWISASFMARQTFDRLVVDLGPMEL